MTGMKPCFTQQCANLSVTRTMRLEIDLSFSKCAPPLLPSKRASSQPTSLTGCSKKMASSLIYSIVFSTKAIKWQKEILSPAHRSLNHLCKNGGHTCRMTHKITKERRTGNPDGCCQS